MEQIIVRPRNGNRDGSGIRFADSKGLTLKLRDRDFKLEMESLHIPDDLEQAINFTLQTRAATLENRYNQVFAYVRLQQFGSFWEDFGCKSLSEWLAMVDLPAGSTLASREVMVRLFSKETFILVGDDMLGEMIYLISKTQPDSDARIKDYQTIFDVYAKSNKTFDKQRFREIVNFYVNKAYTIPAGHRVDDVKARPPRLESKGTRTYKVAKALAPSEAQASSRNMQADFIVERRVDTWREAALRHIERLERMVAEKQGQAAVPIRPAILAT